MSKRFFLCWFLFLMGTQAFTQPPNPDCKRIYDRAVVYFNLNNYQAALKCLAAIKVIDERWKPKADTLILAVYRRVNRQKALADTAAKREERQRVIATQALANANLSLSKAIGISALENIKDGNKLKAKALLESIAQEHLPVSEEVYCALLGASAPLFRFKQVLAINEGFDYRYDNRLAGIDQADGDGLYSVVDDAAKLTFFDPGRGRVINYPLMKKCGTVKALGKAIYESRKGDLLLFTAPRHLAKLSLPRGVSVTRAIQNDSAKMAILQTGDGRLLRCALNDSLLRVTDTLMDGSVNDFDISEGGDQIAATPIGKLLFIWDRDKRFKKTTYGLDSILQVLSLVPRYSHPLVKLSRDGRLAAVVLPTMSSAQPESYLVLIYNTSTGQQVNLVVTHFEVGIETGDFDFDPSGKELLINQHTGVTLINTSTGSIDLSIDVRSAIYAFQPKGDLLALADKTDVRIYDLSNMTMIEKATAGKKAITALCFDHTGKSLVLADMGGAVKTLYLDRAADPGYAITPNRFSQRHFFSEGGDYYIACEVISFLPVRYGLFLYDLRRGETKYLMAVQILPTAIFFKDPSKVFLVAGNQVSGMDCRDSTRFLAWTAPGRIERAAFDSRHQKLIYLSNGILYQRPVTSVVNAVKPIRIDPGLSVRNLIASPLSGKCLLVGTRDRQRVNVAIEIAGDKLLPERKLPVAPLAAFYDAQDRPMILGRDKLLFLTGRSTERSITLSTALPVFTFTDFVNNFSGRNFILIPRESTGKVALNLLYISTLTGYTTELDNPSAGQYAENDNTFTAIMINELNELETLSIEGYLQIWGRPLKDPKQKTEQETNLTVVGSVAVPLK